MKLGQVGDDFKLTLSFHLETSGQLEQFQLASTIQNIEVIQKTNPDTALYKHGLKFAKNDPRVVLYIYELQQIK